MAVSLRTSVKVGILHMIRSTLADGLNRKRNGDGEDTTGRSEVMTAEDGVADRYGVVARQMQQNPETISM
jgi:hypothetical protein